VILNSRILRAAVFLTGMIASAAASRAQTPTKPSTPSADELKFVVIVSRHGVRSPTGKVDQLNQYSAQPWPKWTVPPGYLTEHGAKLMTLFGAYDHQWLAHLGLLNAEGCGDASHITILADSDQRTRETGKALAIGLMPGCSIDVHAEAEGEADPLFHPLEAGVGHPDKAVATAAVSGRIGANPAGLVEAYRPQLKALEEVLGQPASKSSLFDIPSSISSGKGDHLVDLKSPLGTAATMSENLLLEYTEGMPQVGWGRVDSVRLRELLQLHTASADIERRTPYLARAQASNMLAHVLDSLRQAASAKPVPGALSRPEDKLLILVGHDTNLTNIAGDLNLSWLIDGRRDDTPPGGALVFELWKSATGNFSVRTYYTAQTLDQMRNAVPLTLAAPPERVAVFVPGCSGADSACRWNDFESTIRAAIDQESVQ
jgi:4-phytase/acid phosphatase